MPRTLHDLFKESKLRQNCNTDSEAVRLLIHKAIESENIPDNNSIIHDRKGA